MREGGERKAGDEGRVGKICWLLEHFAPFRCPKPRGEMFGGGRCREPYVPGEDLMLWGNQTNMLISSLVSLSLG